MQVKRLLSSEEHTAFSNQYKAQSDLPVSADYLARSEVWGLYDRETLVAGFIVNRKLPFRHLSFPQFDRHFLTHFMHRNAVRQVVEISCVWRQRRRSFSAWQKAELYGRMLQKAVSLRSLFTNAVIMGGSFNEKVRSRQKTVLPRVLFNGYLVVNGELKQVELHYGHVWPMIGRLIPQFTLLAIQQGFKTVRKRFRQYPLDRSVY